MIIIIIIIITCLNNLIRSLCGFKYSNTYISMPSIFIDIQDISHSIVATGEVIRDSYTGIVSLNSVRSVKIGTDVTSIGMGGFKGL